MRILRSLKLQKKVTAFLTLFSLSLNILQPAFLALSLAPIVTPASVRAEDEIVEPTPTPSTEPAPTPSADPTAEPSAEPSIAPSPSSEPSVAPTPSSTPDISPSPVASVLPSPAPSSNPTPAPSNDTPSNPEPTQDSSPAPPVVESPTPSVSPSPAPTNLDEELHIIVIEKTEADSIAEFDLEVTETGSATLSTDKLDYAPTDTALITGNDFLPNTTYSLTISSEDVPATSTTVEVTTDEAGTLFYAYQLDGIYRPNYKVEAKDATGAIVAVITFTDSDTTFKNPSAIDGNHDDWSDASNAYSSNNIYATETTEDQEQSYENFGFSIPAGSTINGIELRLEGFHSDNSGCQIEPRMWSESDNDHSDRINQVVTGADTVYTLGSPTNLWGATWIPSDFDNDNFHAEVRFDDTSNSNGGSCDSGTFSLDHLQVKVYYTEPAPQPDLTIVKSHTPAGNAATTVPFTWKLHVANTGAGAAAFANTQTIITDNLPNAGATYGSPSVSNASGLTGTINCSIASSNLSCVASGAVTLNAGGSFDVTWSTTPTATGSLVNPRSGQVCKVDPTSTNGVVAESNESNNTCSETVTVNTYVAPNPSLNATCGLDIALVLDNSTSIDSGEMTQMKNAITAFVTALSGTPTHYSVSRFATTASVVQAFTGNTTDVNNAINGIPVGGGYTNWEDGLLKGQSTLPHRINPNLVIFASDGNPNTIGNGPANNASPDGSPTAMNPAITVANAIKSSGARMLAIGIGSDLNTANLQAIAGPLTNTGNILTSDVITTDFSTLASQLNTFASQSCGGTVTVTKKIDADGSLATTNDQTVASGWTFNVGGQAGKVTDANGQTPAITLVAGSNYSITETQQNNYSLLQASCTGATNNGTSNLANNNINGIQIGNTDIVSCTFINTPPVETVDICHATGSHGNPYITNSPSKSGDVSGHDDHNGPTWFPGIAVEWGDIIPPFSYPGGSYPGQNWDTAGQAIFNNGCNLPNGTLTVTKNLVPNNDPGLFNLTINGTPYASNVGHNGTTGAQSVAPATYTVGETAGTNTSLSNYTTTYGGDCNAQGQVTVGVAQNKSCTITNTRKAGNITFLKEVIGGDAEPTDWEFDVLNVGTFQNGTFVFNTGVYSVTETSDVLGYSLTGVSGVCSNPNPASGSATLTVTEQGGTCTFTNTRDTGSVKVNKLLDNDANSTFETVNPAAFNWSLDGVGTNAMGSTVSNVTTTVGGVTHSVNENSVANYHFVGWYPTGSTQYSCANPQGTTLPLTVSVSKNTTTDITFCNAADSATLKVIKVVTNDDGGTKEVADFPLFVDGQSVVSEAVNTFGFGSHLVSETNLPGYAATFSGDCDAQGNVSLASGDAKTCTITNNDIAPKLTVTKVVSSGTALVTDFPLFVDQTQVGSGVQNTFDADTYTVSETNQPGYTGVISGDCSANGSVTLNLGDVKSCMITNSRDTGSITIVKDAQPNNAQDFRFTGNLGEFYLDDDGNNGNTLSNTKVFSNLETGTYTVTEPNDFPGVWDLESVTCVGGSDAQGNNRNAVIKLEKGENVTCTFVNVRETGTITIVKDAINDHGQDFSFTTTGGLGSFILDDDGNNNNTRSNTKVFTAPTGAYTVTESNTNGWKLTDLTCNDENGSVNLTTRKATLSLEADENITCTFENTQLAKVWGFKFNDENADGDWDLFDGEFGLGNWHITLTGEDEFEDDTYTSNFFLTRGFYEFHNLLPGDYEICEVMQDGWVNTTPLCQDINLNPGEINHFVNFGNAHNGDLEVTKYNDKNGNGQQDEGEEVLSGWEINLEGKDSLVTGQDGKALFEDLTSGSYELSETMQEGWTQTNISCGREGEPEQGGYEVYINPGQTTYCQIGNQADPLLTIEKSNDAAGAQAPGSDVMYTLKVELQGSNVNNVFVTDTTPTGFTYRAGSWTANSSVRGDISGLGEPTYASPGVWTLGNMVVGEIVTLTYMADISNTQDSGTYKDIAWATGNNSFSGDPVDAQGQNSEYVDGVFVGTDVEIIKSEQQTGTVNIEKTGEVLGASTELPATGVDSTWLFLALVLLIAGLLFTFGGKFMKKLLAVVTVLVAIFSFATSAQAATNNLSVRMESPKSPTRLNDWKLAFSTLDRTGAEITVKCYVKKPSEGSFTQFDAEVFPAMVDKSSGGSNACQVNSSVISAQGTYEFKVIASTSGETDESDTASVLYDTDGPGTPTGYNKEHPSQCRWIIRFHTADDGGLTQKVEIYSSDHTNFDTHDGTRVGTVSIGSNQDGEFIHDRGADCDKTWYYVIRAYDALGNQSGHTGDSVDHTVTVSPSPTTSGALIVPAGQGSILGDNNADNAGEVMGEATPTSSTDGQGLIAGATEAAKQIAKSGTFWWILSAIIALGIIYVIARKKIQG